MRYYVIPSTGDGAGEDPVDLGEHEDRFSAVVYMHKFFGAKSRRGSREKHHFILLEIPTGAVDYRLW